MKIIINPKVSVLMITYNQEKFIENAINSVLQQDYDNFEIIISDDASIDNTLNILDRYNKLYPTKITIIKNSKRGGITVNSQRVLKQATGDFVAFIAGDDLWLPGKLTAQVNWFINNPDYSICYHDIAILDVNKNLILGNHSDYRKMVEGTTEQVLYYRCFAALLSVMIKKNAIPENGFNEDIPTCSDWFLVIDSLIQNNGKIGFINKVYANYNKHENNITKLNKHLYLEGIIAYKQYKYKHTKYKEQFDLCLAEELIVGIVKSILNKDLHSMLYCFKELLFTNNIFKALFRVLIVKIIKF